MTGPTFSGVAYRGRCDRCLQLSGDLRRTDTTRELHGPLLCPACRLPQAAPDPAYTTFKLASSAAAKSLEDAGACPKHTPRIFFLSECYAAGRSWLEFWTTVRLENLA